MRSTLTKIAMTVALALAASGVPIASAMPDQVLPSEPPVTPPAVSPLPTVPTLPGVPTPPPAPTAPTVPIPANTATIDTLNNVPGLDLVAGAAEVNATLIVTNGSDVPWKEVRIRPKDRLLTVRPTGHTGVDNAASWTSRISTSSNTVTFTSATPNSDVRPGGSWKFKIALDTGRPVNDKQVEWEVKVTRSADPDDPTDPARITLAAGANGLKTKLHVLELSGVRDQDPSDDVVSLAGVVKNRGSGTVTAGFEFICVGPTLNVTPNMSQTNLVSSATPIGAGSLFDFPAQRVTIAPDVTNRIICSGNAVSSAGDSSIGKVSLHVRDPKVTVNLAGPGGQTAVKNGDALLVTGRTDCLAASTFTVTLVEQGVAGSANQETALTPPVHGFTRGADDGKGCAFSLTNAAGLSPVNYHNTPIEIIDKLMDGLLCATLRQLSMPPAQCFDARKVLARVKIAWGGTINPTGSTTSESAALTVDNIAPSFARVATKDLRTIEVTYDEAVMKSSDGTLSTDEWAVEGHQVAAVALGADPKKVTLTLADSLEDEAEAPQVAHLPAHSLAAAAPGVRLVDVAGNRPRTEHVQALVDSRSGPVLSNATLCLGPDGLSVLAGMSKAVSGQNDGGDWTMTVPSGAVFTFDDVDTGAPQQALDGTAAQDQPRKLYAKDRLLELDDPDALDGVAGPYSVTYRYEGPGGGQYADGQSPPVIVPSPSSVVVNDLRTSDCPDLPGSSPV